MNFIDEEPVRSFEGDAGLAEDHERERNNNPLMVRERQPNSQN